MPLSTTERSRGRSAAPTEAPAQRVLDDSALQHLLGYRLALAEAAARRVFQRHIGKAFELRPVEFTILLLVQANGCVSPKQLSQALGMPPPNVTVLIDRLEQRNCLQRERSPSDGRATILRLTPEGADLARRTRRVSLNMEGGLLAPLSMAERVTLARLLARLADKQGDGRAA